MFARSAADGQLDGRGVSRETGGGRAARRPRVARQRGSSAVKPSAERVPRETLEALVAQYDLEPGVAAKFERLLAALAAEPDPHTTVRDPPAAADVHIADSLGGLVVPELRKASTVVDIGAGPGFPGLVLAAAIPEARVDLIESTRRKVDVLERLAAAAGIDARPVAARAEDWARGE